jgi:predicted ester cyclase
MTFMERWFEEVWNKGREDAIDEMMSPSTQGHGLKGPDGKEVDGIAAFKSFHRTFHSAFFNIHVKVEETVTEGDRTVARCIVTGLHTGDGLGKPSTGKPVTFHGMSMVRLKDGKIVESWNNFDFMTMYKQLE